MPRDAEADLARSVAQAGVLEEQLARATRHRGMLTGLLVGALKDDALTPVYRDLAERVLGDLQNEGAPVVWPR